MQRIHRIFAGLALFFAIALPTPTFAQVDSARLEELERRVARAEHRGTTNGAAGVAAFVSAAFCALWAQQTRRNAWLWFFCGGFFSPIALLVLLYKNSNDKTPGA